MWSTWQRSSVTITMSYQLNRTEYYRDITWVEHRKPVLLYMIVLCQDLITYGWIQILGKTSFKTSLIVTKSHEYRSNKPT